MRPYEIGAAAAELLLERLRDAAAEPRQLTENDRMTAGTWARMA
jgi:hypothetical protein